MGVPEEGGSESAPEEVVQPSPQDPDRQAQPVDAEEPPRLPFPVVGIGASAGGLEAVSEFLGAMPPDGGMAFILVQHLPPDRRSLLADILGKRTAMPVREVVDGMPVEVNHVYVIRPGHVLTIRESRLHLGPELGGPRAANSPIDDFFKSLAEEQRERAVAIIMSGMGSNGSAGAQALKAVGGLCIAQDPESAQFAAMPRHLIDSGNADHILRPTEMPDVLLAYAGHPYVRGGRELSAAATLRREHGHLREILTVLRTRTRQEFGGYKKPTILRRIQRRMGLNRVTDMSEYVKLLRQNPAEVTGLADDLLIHVTGFFRDAEAWETLRERVIVPLVAAREPEAQIRCWVTACSTGDEAYTLAILLVEEAERVNKRLDIKVFATDMAERTLAMARAGVYPGGIEAEISPERLSRFFQKEDAVYRVRPDLRERVVFAPQNVLQDPPFSRLDIATCRNLLIYLEPEVQERVLSLMHFGLREGGALFLGTSETVSGADGMFEPLDKKAKIFRRVGPTRHGLTDFPLPQAMRSVTTLTSTLAAGRQPGPRPTFAQITQRALLEHHLPAAVLVDRDYRIQYYQGDTRPFLGAPRGEPTRDLMELALEGVRGAARVALRRAAAQNGPSTVLDGWVVTESGRRARVAVTASPTADAGAPDHFVVSFELRRDTPTGERPAGAGGASEAGDSHVADEELRRARDELQSTIEELQTANEEMKAAAEEASSINEELQSSNEELETSKEEMQSLNEELNTVNAQLQAKAEEHQATANDLASLLASTDIAVLFLDPRMRIRRFTPPLRELIDLMASDAGRPLTDLARKFDDPHLAADAEAVLAKLVPVEREVSAHDGRWFLRRVTPYRTTDNRIDGVVVTFVDITRRKHAELEVSTARQFAESIVKTLHEPLLVLSSDLTVRNANEAFYQHFRVKAGETVGRKIYQLGNGQWDIPALRQALEEVLPTDQVFNDYEVVHEFDDIGRRVMLLNGRRMDQLQLILLGVRDVTEQHSAVAALRKSEERYRTLFESIDVGYCIVEILLPEDTGRPLDYRFVETNPAFDRQTGVSDAVGRRMRDIAPDLDEFWYQTYAKVALTGEPVRFEAPAAALGQRIYDVYAFRIGDPGQRRVAILFNDIAGRKRVEQAVRDSEARFRALVTASAYVLYRMNGDWSQVLRLDGGGFMTDTTVPSSTWLQTYIHPDDQPSVRAVIDKAVREKKLFELEHRVRRADGTLGWTLSRAVPLLDENGEVSEWFGAASDVTARREAEDALRGSEERFRLVVEGARDFAMLLFDADGRITAWNVGAERLLGHTEAEAVGQDGAIIFTPEDRAAGAPEQERAEATTKERAVDERWHVRKNNTRFWGSGVMTALRSPDGSVRGYVKVLGDETNRKRAEDAVQAAKASAELTNRVKDEFLATLSHELRTPLSAILIWANMLADKGRAPTPDQLAEGLAAIRSSAEAQNTLIEDLLDTSRITSGKLRLRRTGVDLAALVRDAIVAVLPAAEAKGVTVSADADPAAGVVSADADRLRQVVWNLLVNAIKFTPAGGHVDVGLWRRGDEVEIRVSDTGQGIDPAFVPNVFDLFRQADGSSSRRHGGLGLGLAICKQLVTLHGGTIRVESEGAGRGAAFVVRLPLSRLREDGAAGGVVKDPAAREADGIKGVRVLLVEDEPETRNALVALLGRAGADVRAVDSAHAALEAIPQSRPDVLLSDIGLPEMDGYELIRRLRRHEVTAHSNPIPAIALTAFVRDEDRGRALASGFDHHLNKPVKKDEVIAAIANAVRPAHER